MAASVNRRPASVLIRLAAMVYESILLFGVVFVAGYALLAAARWTYPLAPYQRWTLQAVLFVAIGAYFAYCWTRTGQTLAMKSWHLRLLGADGHPLSLARAIARYVLAWHLFLPGALWYAAFGGRPALDALVAAAGFAALVLAAYADAERRFLHDRLLGTRVVHEVRDP
jgi:uncharacterized RDD family membrane protein YckC